MKKRSVNLTEDIKVDVSNASKEPKAPSKEPEAPSKEEVITLSDSQNNKVEAMGITVSNRNNFFSLELDNKALKEAEDDKLLTLFMDLYNEQVEKEEIARDKILGQTIALFKHTASKILVSSTHKRVQKESDEIIKSIVIGFGENRLYKILLLEKMSYKHYKKVFKLEKYIQKSILKDLKEEAPNNYNERLDNHLAYAQKLHFIHKAVMKEDFTAPKGFTNPLHFDSHGRIAHNKTVSAEVYAMHSLLTADLFKSK